MASACSCCRAKAWCLLSSFFSFSFFLSFFGRVLAGDGHLARLWWSMCQGYTGQGAHAAVRWDAFFVPFSSPTPRPPPSPPTPLPPRPMWPLSPVFLVAEFSLAYPIVTFVSIGLCAFENPTPPPPPPPQPPPPLTFYNGYIARLTRKAEKCQLPRRLS